MTEFNSGGSEKKYNHYFRKIGNVHIDIYRLLLLFNVTDPCIQHAVKKLLCPGIRGSKDIEKDIDEAIDTLIRRKEMLKEDADWRDDTL